MSIVDNVISGIGQLPGSSSLIPIHHTSDSNGIVEVRDHQTNKLMSTYKIPMVEGKLAKTGTFYTARNLATQEERLVRYWVDSFNFYDDDIQDMVDLSEWKIVNNEDSSC